jgi:predicted aspartyl protease
MTYPFETDPISRLIYVDIRVNEVHKFRMMLDTGATTTTFDINALIVAGFPVGNVVGENTVETANGMMAVDIIQTETISALGHTVRGMKVQMYDFYKHGILSDYDGLLGLDFFENTKFTVDMNNQTIEVYADD